MFEDSLSAAWRDPARVVCSRAAAALSILLTMAVWVGCASWKPDAEPELARGGLPAAKIADEVAILEVAFVRLPPPRSPSTAEGSPSAAERTADAQDEPHSEEGNREEGNREPAAEAALIWDRMDESIVPGEMRSRLAANGIRVGRFLSIDRGQLEAIAPIDESARLMEEADVASDFGSRLRRISCRDGQPYTLAVRQAKGDNVSTLIRTEGGVVGRSLEDPQFMLIMRTRMLDDGRIAVRLVPEIQHGEMRQNYVSNDLAFRMEFQREQWTLDELMCEVPLSEGQAMVLMPSEETFGLGKRMFIGRRADLAQERVAVVVRLQRRPVSRIGS